MYDLPNIREFPIPRLIDKFNSFLIILKLGWIDILNIEFSTN